MKTYEEKAEEYLENRVHLSADFFRGVRAFAAFLDQEKEAEARKSVQVQESKPQCEHDKGHPVGHGFKCDKCGKILLPLDGGAMRNSPKKPKPKIEPIEGGLDDGIIFLIKGKINEIISYINET